MCHFSHSMLLKLLGNQKLVQPQGPHPWFGQLFGRCADQAKLVVPLVVCLGALFAQLQETFKNKTWFSDAKQLYIYSQ